MLEIGVSVNELSIVALMVLHALLDSTVQLLLILKTTNDPITIALEDNYSFQTDQKNFLNV